MEGSAWMPREEGTVVFYNKGAERPVVSFPKNKFQVLHEQMS